MNSISSVPQGCQSVANLLPHFLDTLLMAADQPLTSQEQPTGLFDLDRVIGSFDAGELIVIGGRPAMGKSSLVIAICTQAVPKKLPVLMLSETPNAQVVHRLVATSGIDLTRLRTGRLTDAEWPILTETIEKLRNARIYLRDISGYRACDVPTVVESVQLDLGPLGMVLIDGPPLGEAPSAASLTPSLACRCKRLAVDLGIPVIATAQVGAAPASTSVRCPMPSELISAQEIELYADVVILVHRNGYYFGGSAESEQAAEIFVARNRRGPTAAIDVGFRHGVARFENWRDLNTQVAIAGQIALGGAANARES